MLCALDDNQILELLQLQLKSYWGGNKQFILGNEDKKNMRDALSKTDKCFSMCKSDFYHKNGETVFHVEHSVQYSIFLYFLSNTLYHSNKIDKASSVYYLNKIMNGVELFYAVELPEHFNAEHPLGSVMGKASYGDYFFFYQGCTVGGNMKGNQLFYPTIGSHVTMYSNAKILGDCHIGNNVVIGANSYIKDMDVPNNSIVFGQYPNIVIKEHQEKKIESIRRHLWL